MRKFGQLASRALARRAGAAVRSHVCVEHESAEQGSLNVYNLGVKFNLGHLASRALARRAGAATRSHTCTQTLRALSGYVPIT